MSPQRQAKRKSIRKKKREIDIGTDKEKRKVQWKRASEETNLIYYQQKSAADVRVWPTLCSQLVKCTQRSLYFPVFLSSSSDLHVQTPLHLHPNISSPFLSSQPQKQTNALHTGTCTADHKWNTVALYCVTWRNVNNPWWRSLRFLVMSCEMLWTLDETLFSSFWPYTHWSYCFKWSHMQ